MGDSFNERTFTFGLRLGQEKLKAVLKAGSALNSTLDLDNVLTGILTVSVEQLGSETGTVFLANDDETALISKIVEGDKVRELIIPITRGLAGAAYSLRKILNIKNPYTDKRFDSSFDEKTGYKTRNILSIPMLDRQGRAIGVIQVLNKKEGHFTEDDEDFAAILATFAAIAVENAKQIKYTIERERLEKELSLAKKIQSTFLQGEIPAFPGYDISAVSNPCYQIGGDYMRLSMLNKDEYLFVIADVSGKGIPAALITLALHAYINMLLPSEIGILSENIAAVKRIDYPVILNNLLLSVTVGRSFVTLCGGILNRKTGKIVLCNCGHSSPILMHKDGSWEKIDSTMPVLGLLPEIEVGTITKEINAGDIFVMYTDGVVEAAAGEADEEGNREEYGLERLAGRLLADKGKSSAEISKIILKDIDEFTKDYIKEDDLTLIIVKKD